MFAHMIQFLKHTIGALDRPKYTEFSHCKNKKIPLKTLAILRIIMRT